MVPSYNTEKFKKILTFPEIRSTAFPSHLGSALNTFITPIHRLFISARMESRFVPPSTFDPISMVMGLSVFSLSVSFPLSWIFNNAIVDHPNNPQ
jgi:hypothetical protein